MRRAVVSTVLALGLLVSTAPVASAQTDIQGDCENISSIKQLIGCLLPF